MELRHLRYFVAVAEELSFTKAARKLRLAQPSLTRQVRNLEDELGVRLLDRSKNQIALTEEGASFFSDAQRVLATCAESISAVQRMSRGESSRLNVGYVAHFHYDLLPATLGAFGKSSPHVALNLFDMGSTQQIQALEDLGFVGLPPTRTGSDLCSQRIAQDTVLVALAQRHRLAGNSKIKLPELTAEFVICMAAKHDPEDCEWVNTTCRTAGFTAKILQVAVDAPNALRFVKDGLGVALLPEQITGLPHEGVTFRPLSPPLRRPSTIAWRADNTSKPLKDFIRIVTELSGSRGPLFKGSK